MERVIVVVTPSEAAAYQTLKAIKQLDADGTIELYGATVIARDADGRVSTKSSETNEGLGTAFAVSMGALVGMLAGPVGAAAGATIGATGGLMGEAAYSGFAADFLQQVSTRLSPGKSAVCASVWEDWTVPIDSVATASGGEVVRQSTEEVATAHLKSEMQAIKDDQSHAKEAIARAAGEAKASMQSQVEAMKARQNERIAQMKMRADEMQRSWDEKIAAIQAKAANSEAEAKKYHELHREKLARFAATQKASFKELFA
jgi:uncharacterized membrane protein